jgi:hypothetical protein
MLAVAHMPNRVLDAQTTQPAVRLTRASAQIRRSDRIATRSRPAAFGSSAWGRSRVVRCCCRTAQGPGGSSQDRAHCIDPSYQMIGWNHIIEMEFVEELPLIPGQPTHHRPSQLDRLSRTESCFAAGINGVLQHNRSTKRTLKSPATAGLSHESLAYGRVQAPSHGPGHVNQSSTPAALQFLMPG